MEDLPVKAALPAPDEIPDKIYFRIGEVASLAGIKPHVLRFWESEFQRLGPQKTGTGHRLYRRKDVELVLEIKRLLYEKRFTIAGARKFLDSPRRHRDGERLQPLRQGELFALSPARLNEVRQGLAEILAMLNH